MFDGCTKCCHHGDAPSDALVLEVQTHPPGVEHAPPEPTTPREAETAGQTPAAAAVRITSSGTGTYEITIKKSPPEKNSLGVDLDYRDRVTLEIEKINPGLVRDWNDTNKDKEVKVGDRIMAVNGISGDAVKMIQACKDSTTVTMSIRTGG